jgi:RND family efflux transporter MFP subunit
MIRNKVKSVLIIALACLLAVGFSACPGQVEEGQGQLAEVVRGDLLVTVSADGNLSFVKDKKLTFGITGTIAEVNVEEGDWVSQGTVLAKLDNTSLELVARAAEVDLEIAETSYRSLTYPYTYSTLAFDVPAALASIADAKEGLEKAWESLDMELSFEQYWKVKQGLEQAEEKLTEAAQRLARGRGEDAFASGVLNVADFWTIRAAQLGVDRAQVALDMANDDLAKAVMVAPFDGIIALVDIKEGDSLSAMDYATKTIIELVDPTEMELSAEVDEIDIPIVQLGQRAVIEVDALPGVQLEGEIKSVSPLASEESGLVLYKIKVGFEAPEGSGLKAGMSATADIIIAERTDVLLVPSRAVGEDSQGNLVVNVLADGQVEERAVVIGISDGYDTEILSGLEEGEVVMVERKSSSIGGFTFGE